MFEVYYSILLTCRYGHTTCPSPCTWSHHLSIRKDTGVEECLIFRCSMREKGSILTRWNDTDVESASSLCRWLCWYSCLYYVCLFGWKGSCVTLCPILLPLAPRCAGSPQPAGSSTPVTWCAKNRVRSAAQSSPAFHFACSCSVRPFASPAKDRQHTAQCTLLWFKGTTTTGHIHTTHHSISLVRTHIHCLSNHQYYPNNVLLLASISHWKRNRPKIYSGSHLFRSAVEFVFTSNWTSAYSVNRSELKSHWSQLCHIPTTTISFFRTPTEPVFPCSQCLPLCILFRNLTTSSISLLPSGRNKCTTRPMQPFQH